LFKLEGKFERGFFPGLKNYYLDSEISGDDSGDQRTKIKDIKGALYRAKGISQSCQNSLCVDNFKVSVDNSGLFTHRWQLKSFPNLTVGIAPATRKLNKPLNLKRTFVVRIKIFFSQHGPNYSSRLFLFQNQVHSIPLGYFDKKRSLQQQKDTPLSR